MKKTLSLALLLLLLLVLPFACDRLADAQFGSVKAIHVKSDLPAMSLSGYFDITGFTKILPTSGNEIRGVNNVFFDGEKLFLLDNSTDFQHVWLYDLNGNPLGQVGYFSETEEDGFSFINGASWDKYFNQLLVLDAGKMSFKQYDANGRLTRNLPNGMYGETALRTKDGGYVVYNEYGSNEVSKNYHLIFYDKDGNITQRLCPYSTKMDGMSYQFTGFLSQSGNGIWFSPPFCDTVFSVTSKGIAPEYVFDFGESAIPASVRQNKINGWDVDDNSYLHSTFLKLGRFSLFEFYSDRKLDHCLYDEVQNKAVCFRDSPKDSFSYLLGLGKFYARDQNSVLFVVTQERLQYLLEKKLLSSENFDSSLYEAIQTVASQKGGYLVLHLSLNYKTTAM